jgi:anti-anti-sigma factor
VTTPSPLELLSSYADGVLVIEASGEIDMATAPELTTAIEAAVAGTKGVVIDLTNVEFLDSSALNALVHSRRELAARGVAFHVVSPTEQVVRRVFEITQLTDELGVVASRADIPAVE